MSIYVLNFLLMINLIECVLFLDVLLQKMKKQPSKDEGCNKNGG